MSMGLTESVYEYGVDYVRLTEYVTKGKGSPRLSCSKFMSVLGNHAIILLV